MQIATFKKTTIQDSLEHPVTVRDQVEGPTGYSCEKRPKKRQFKCVSSS